jgi:ABC-type nitrate/sulfonate/bicarbonate transport system substrate-binding protein
MPNRFTSISAALAIALALPADAQTAATTVRVGYFSTSLPLMAAQANGFFADEGLAVATLQVRSSVQMFQRMRDDLMDVAISSPDNPLNYRLNPHNAVGVPLDVTMLFGADLGLQLSVVSRAPFTTFESLRGKRIGVDAPDSGFAYVLYRILELHGLRLADGDYTLVIVGGTPIRYQALRAGTIDATLLNSDSIVRARNDGMNSLAPVAEVATPYLGTVASVREGWLAAHPDVAVGFVRAYWRGQAWAMDPANRDEALAMLRTLPNTSATVAEQIYAQLDEDPTGLIAGARLDRKGLMNVIRLRDEAGGFETDQNLRWLDTPASGIFDLEPWRRATNQATADDVVGTESNPMYEKTWPELHDPSLLGGHDAHGHDADGDLE